MFNSKPKEPDRGHCPMLNKPCMGERCSAWMVGLVEEATPSGPVVRERGACVSFFWVPLYLKDIAARADGTQNVMESFRNETVKASGELNSMLSTAVQLRRLKYVNEE
jgi:hypothetical protein